MMDDKVAKLVQKRAGERIAKLETALDDIVQVCRESIQSEAIQNIESIAIQGMRHG